LEQTDTTLVTDLTQIINHEEVISLIKKEFFRIDTNSAITLAELIINNETKINVKQFKQKHKSFVRKNLGKFEKPEDEENGDYYLKEEIVEFIKKKLIIIVEKIGSSIKDVEDDSDRWSLSQVDGIEAFETTKYTTFQDIREKINREGKNIEFRYSFKKSDLKTSFYENKSTLQMIDVHINNNGEHFDYPIKYVYVCPMCETISSMMEYKVASTNNKHKCRQMVTKDDKLKTCNTPLNPDTNRTITKDAYIYDITFKDKEGKEQKADAMSFQYLPKGHLKVVLQKIPQAYGRLFVHIVDFQPIDKESMKLPEKTAKEHYVFTLIKHIDKYIKEKTGYVHYGYLPAKISMLAQMGSRHIPGFKYNFHISLSGDMSSGKSQFARYWGITLYAEDVFLSNATSVSIPKLRGTMESFHLFGKEHRYQYRGLLGEKKLIVIDEIKENPELKNSLKQYSLEPVYDYSKQGSNNQTYKRTAQLVVTQNIDTKHLDKYAKDIKTLYQSDTLKLTNDDGIEPKPAWDQHTDLTLPLYTYKNRYLKYCIKKIREEYERNTNNWIDGSEIALKQRFYFYYYLGSSKTNKKLTHTIKQNNITPIISNNLELVRIMCAKELVEYLENTHGYTYGENDLEYFDKIDELLSKYDKRGDARTKEMSYTLIKILRIIDKRKYCNEEDLRILQYILENVDNKVEVIDTDEFKINNTYIKKDDVEETNIEEENKDSWGYDDTFK